ncbi:MAG: EAL domain-containing protein [Azonexus sp.]|nr:EAL domain-containing protein [Azonexus sp.]
MSLPRETYPAEYTIFEYGTPGDCAYIIESGSVRVSSYDNRCLAILGPGALFGEVALLDQQVRTATVRTIEEAVLIRIERGHMEELLRRTDPVIRHLLKILLERFRANYLGIHPPARNLNSHSDQLQALRTLTLTRDLSYALDNDKPTLYYQPVVDCVTHELIGFEALIRWPHPTQGMIMPNEFIGLAEKTGLIHPLGLWVLQRAISDWATLRQFCSQGPLMHPFVSVNVSADELSDPRLIDSIFVHLEARGIPPHELKIELTETVVIENRESVGDMLQALAGRGIGIALDDFGTGYASMEYLRSLPISTLKIDRSFVQDMTQISSSDEIVHSAIRLGASLGMTVVAEGVENEATAKRLGAFGCHLAQGFYYAEPMPAMEVAAWVAQAKRSGMLDR